jgi:predicted RNase H-like nuclease (RuvC/YqgF family)
MKNEFYLELGLGMTSDKGKIIKEKDEEIAYLRRQLAWSEKCREKLRDELDDAKSLLNDENNEYRSLKREKENLVTKRLRLEAEKRNLTIEEDNTQRFLNFIMMGGVVTKSGWGTDPSLLGGWKRVDVSWMKPNLPPPK